MKTLLFVAAMMLLPSVTAVSDPQSALKCQVQNKMTPLVFLGLLLGTCDASVPASNNGFDLPAIANSTDVVEVARREIACTPTGTEYLCYKRGYTQVPNTVWIATTTKIYLNNNEISFIPVNEFNGLTLLEYIHLSTNAIKSIPVGMVDTNIALEELGFSYNAITSVPVGMVDNNPALKYLYLNDNLIKSIPVGMLDNNPALVDVALNRNKITSVPPVGFLNNNPALVKVYLHGNAIKSIPVGMLDTNIALETLYLSGNPLQCPNFIGTWVVGTKISSICTSCTEGTPQTATCGSLQIDFRQCDSQCVVEPNSESPTVSSPTVSPTVSPTIGVCALYPDDGGLGLTSCAIVATNGECCTNRNICQNYCCNNQFTCSPTSSPTVSPTTSTPTMSPTTSTPSVAPTVSPSVSPSLSPSTSTPSTSPTVSSPTVSPTIGVCADLNDGGLGLISCAIVATNGECCINRNICQNYCCNNQFTCSPTSSPTVSPTTSTPTMSPTTSTPSVAPTVSPSVSPSLSPSTSTPSTSPTVPTCLHTGLLQVHDVFSAEVCGALVAGNQCGTPFMAMNCNTSCCFTASPTISPTVSPTSAPTPNPTPSPTTTAPTPSPTPSSTTTAPTPNPTPSPTTTAPTPNPTPPPTTTAPTPFDDSGSGEYTPSPTTTAPTTNPTPSPTTTASTPNPTPSAEITKATEPPQECPNNCGTVEQGGGTCKADSTGALGCLSCNKDRVLIKGKFNGEFVGICKKTVYCKSRKLFSGAQVGYPCRCTVDNCHYCIQSGTEPENCKVCRDGAFMLNNKCIETCPDDMASVGVSLFKRRCEAPFTCKSGRTPSGDGCKCATNENAKAACNKCEFEAGQFGQKCLNCAGSLYLNPENNQCEEGCAPFEESGLIPYLVGTYGGQCRKPFTCTSKKDEAKEKCKCDKSLGACEVCDYTAVGPTCKVCGQKKYLDIKNGVCVKKCPADTNPVGDGNTGRECAPQ